MRIGIIGGTGFVGSNLATYCRNHDIEYVIGSRRLNVDATSTDSLVTWIRNNNLKHVINLAAECGGIGLNKKCPADLWLSSTKISAAVLEAALLTKLEKIIIVGTACSYAKDCPTPFREEYLMHYGLPESTNSQYGVAKLNALFGSQAFAKQYSLNVTNLIPVNMYGPYDHFDLENSHVIPAMIRKVYDAINTNTNITLWGTGSATREFLYAYDFSEAIIKAFKTTTTSEFINVGSGSEISIKNLIEIICDIMNYTGTITWDSTMPDGQPRRCLDVTKAKDILNFEAKTDLRTGLIDTINWFRNVQCRQ